MIANRINLRSKYSLGYSTSVSWLLICLIARVELSMFWYLKSLYILALISKVKCFDILASRSGHEQVLLGSFRIFKLNTIVVEC